MKISGKIWKFGNDVDTDLIIPARYLNTSDPDELAKHCMEDADPEFSGKVQHGDIIVGGRNFGCGSSREHAPIALKAAGVSCVIARSFARIFYRNAFNMGLPILECDDADSLAAGNTVSVDFDTGIIVNEQTDCTLETRHIPPFMQELINNGGLMKTIEKRLKRPKP